MPESSTSSPLQLHNQVMSAMPPSYCFGQGYKKEEDVKHNE
ncbi:hypothetical protein [Oceanidesulfovibrio marinus]|nr:hypothetical protein [Oceanidesulfovibrio marinus]